MDPLLKKRNEIWRLLSALPSTDISAALSEAFTAYETLRKEREMGGAANLRKKLQTTEMERARFKQKLQVAMNKCDVLRSEIEEMKLVRDADSTKMLKLRKYKRLVESGECVGKFSKEFILRAKQWSKEKLKSIEDFSRELSLKSREELHRRNEEEAKCFLCADRQKEFALQCGHVYCEVCVALIDRCPECKGDASSKIRLFLGLELD